jgi:bacterioferritin
MKGNPNVIAELNKALKAELTAIVQYMVHTEMCANWGYHRLADYIKKQARDEMKHFDGMLERILFLDGTPEVNLSIAPKVGTTVKAQIDNDLAAEHDAVKQYNAAIAVCVQAGDNASREMFEKMVVDEEEHTDFLEAQLQIISDIGMDNYLSQQMHPGESK